MADALIFATLLAFVPYLIAVWRAPQWEWRRVRWLVVTVAVLARVALLPVPLTLSDDVYRYVWEGKVQAAGFNPYKLTPYAPELTHLRDANWEKVQHRSVSSVYPPLLLLVFRLAWHVSQNPLIFKLIFTAFDLTTLYFIVKLLRARGKNESLAVIWAWSPLVILEFAGNAHEMSMAICFFVAGLWLLESRNVARPSPAVGVLFAGACLSHFLAVPLVLVTLLAARVRDVRVWLTLVIVGVGCFVPFADAGRGLILGLANMALLRFNDSIFALLVRWFDHHEFRQVLGEVWVLYPAPKRITAILLAIVFLWTLVRRYNPSRAALTVAGAVLLLSPVVHPWYVTWMVALVCVEFRVAWLAFTGLVIVSYVAKLTELHAGTWVELPAVRWMEYGPFFVLLVAEWWRKRFDSPEPAR